MSQPIFKRQLSHLSTAIFENATEEGRRRLLSISVSRSYFDTESKSWKSTAISLNEADLPAIRKLILETEDWLLRTQGATALEASHG